MGLFSSIFDPGNVFGGNEGGVNLTGIFDPGGTALSAGGMAPDFYGDINGKIDDWASDVTAFEKSNFSDMFKKLKNDPSQLLIGAGDPFSAKAWGKVTGKEYDPYVNQWGGATEQSYQRAEDKGIDTSNARGAHQVAQAIASYYGTAGLGSALGAAGNAAGIGAGAGQVLGGAAIGGGNAWANGQNFMQGAAQGGLGGYLSGIDYAGASGMGDSMNGVFRKGFNGAVGGGLSAGLSGDNVGQGALMGAGKGVAGGLYDSYTGGGDSLGDQQGSLGGNLRDEFGENTTTIGNNPGQSNANAQVLAMGNQAPAGFAAAARQQEGPQESSAVDSFIAALSGGAQKVGGMNGLANLASQAMGMYDNNRNRRRAKEQANDLKNLYSANSPYAQQMRQRMERQDAAAGRRSQYGTRETELAAKMADTQARMAPQLQSLYNQESQARFGMARDGLLAGRNLYNMFGK